MRKLTVLDRTPLRRVRKGWMAKPISGRSHFLFDHLKMGMSVGEIDNVNVSEIGQNFSFSY